MAAEKRIEDVGHYRGEASPYTCDRCGGPTEYVDLRRNIIDLGQVADTVYVLFVECVGCSAGRVVKHFDEELNPYLQI